MFIDDENQHIIEYEMESNEFIYDELMNLDTFAVKHYKNSTYRGEIVDRIREGLGVIVYNNGRVYEGSWG